MPEALIPRGGLAASADEADEIGLSGRVWEYVVERYKKADPKFLHGGARGYLGGDDLLMVVRERGEDLASGIRLVTLGLLRVAWPASFEEMPIELGAYVQGRLQGPGQPAVPGILAATSRMSRPLELSLLAALCEARGLPGLARGLLDRTDRLLQSRSGPESAERRSLSDEFADLLFWNIQLEFGDAGLPWAVLERDLEAYLALFPSGRFRVSAKDLRQGVRKLTQDSSLVSVERTDVEFLAHRLPWQNGYQALSPGKPNVFYDPCRSSPAKLLSEAGVRAIPALASALMDNRPTRTIGWCRAQVQSHYVLRVYDAAAQILVRIKHAHGLDIPISWSGPLTVGRAEMVRKTVLTWLERQH